jgi:anti-anti-sigma factor
MSEEHTDKPSPGPATVVHWLLPGVAQVMLVGEHDLATADEVEQTLTDTIETCSHLLVDVSGADFIDSSTIRVLVSAKGRADESGCRFNLVLGTRPIVERALEITNVLGVLNRVHTVSEVLSGT